jgi:hypothetical protein
MDLSFSLSSSSSGGHLIVSNCVLSRCEYIPATPLPLPSHFAFSSSLSFPSVNNAKYGCKKSLFIDCENSVRAHKAVLKSLFTHDMLRANVLSRV